MNKFDLKHASKIQAIDKVHILPKTRINAIYSTDKNISMETY